MSGPDFPKKKNLFEEMTKAHAESASSSVAAADAHDSASSVREDAAVDAGTGSKQPLKLELDLNVLNHLGINLYSNTPAVLTEIVANAWDADAKNVKVDIDTAANSITIQDDGLGMGYAELQSKFLMVGYARREEDEASTPSGRQCMGRKGIGKLAMFSLAEEITVITKKSGHDPIGIKFSVVNLKKSIKEKKEYTPEILPVSSELADQGSGTVIKLERINNSVNKTENYLRRRIARRFSVIGERHEFQVFVNGAAIGIQDREFQKYIQFLWTFGSEAEGRKTKEQCPNVADKYWRHFDSTTHSGMAVKGFIGSVSKPEELKVEEDNNNIITLMANGRIFEEDIQKRIEDSKVFYSYLVGELELNDLDKNELDDIAVSSRQGVQEDAPRYQEFIAYIKSRLSEIGADWDNWRRDKGKTDISTEFPKIKDWLESLKPRHKVKAVQLLTKTATMRFSGSPEEQKNQRRQILKSQILAFEKLKFQDNLDAISSIDVDKNIEDFREIMITVEDIEASLHRDIVEQRLAVIKKLDDGRANKVVEKVVQDHIYKHLWLLDSRWEYKEHETDYELTLTKYLKEYFPDAENGARLDIGYRTTGGRYVVVELKRPGLENLNAQTLLNQGQKYLMALEQYFTDHPELSPVGGGVPKVDLIYVLEKKPQIPAILQGQFDALGATIRTYQDIITSSRSAYQEYIDASASVGQLRELLNSI